MNFEIINKRKYERGSCPVCDNTYFLSSDEKTGDIVETSMTKLKNGNLVCGFCSSELKPIKEEK